MRMLAMGLWAFAQLTYLAVAGAQPEAVAESISSHQNRDALRLLRGEGDASDAPQWVRGRLLFREGDFTNAAPLLLGNNPGLPARVQSLVSREGLHALVRAQQCESFLANPRLGQEGDWPLGVALQGECLLEVDQPAQAISRLREAIEANHRSVDTFALRLRLITALEQVGDGEEARREIRRAYLMHSVHPEAGDLLARLGEGVERLEFSIGERLRLAARLGRIDHHLEAAEALTPMPENMTDAQRREWLHTRGMAFFRARGHYAEAARDLQASSALGGPTREEDSFHAARALSRADRDAEAVRAYRAFTRRFPNARRAGEAEFLAGWLSLRHRLGDGESMLRRFVRSRNGRRHTAWAKKARWLVAFASFDAGRHRQASREFRDLVVAGEGGMTGARPVYWLARSLQSLGRETEAAASFTRAIEIDPLGWYALLAAARLQEMGRSLPLPLGREPSQEDWTEIERLRADNHSAELPEDVRALQRWGFYRDAERLFGQHTRAWTRQHGPEGTVRAYRRIRAHSQAFRQAVRGWVPRALRGEDLWRWAWSHPTPWSLQVQSQSARFGMDSAYLYGIMRQESAYAPHVQSYAGAMGLLQLMPETAERVALSLGESVRADELFMPTRNIELGAALSRDLLREFSGVEALAIASYNAGEHRIRAWLRAAGEQALDRFVENIPINQTRNYVRRVSGHQSRYRFLSAGNGAWPPLPPLVVGPELIQEVRPSH